MEWLGVDVEGTKPEQVTFSLREHPGPPILKGLFAFSYALNERGQNH